jgi:hypothetical protein
MSELTRLLFFSRSVFNSNHQPFTGSKQLSVPLVQRTSKELATPQRAHTITAQALKRQPPRPTLNTHAQHSVIAPRPLERSHPFDHAVTSLVRPSCIQLLYSLPVLDRHVLHTYLTQLTTLLTLLLRL